MGGRGRWVRKAGARDGQIVRACHVKRECRFSLVRAQRECQSFRAQGATLAARSVASERANRPGSWMEVLGILERRLAGGEVMNEAARLKLKPMAFGRYCQERLRRFAACTRTSLHWGCNVASMATLNSSGVTD